MHGCLIPIKKLEAPSCTEDSTANNSIYIYILNADNPGLEHSTGQSSRL